MTATTAEWLRTADQWKLGRVKDHVDLVNGFPFDSARFNQTAGTPVIRIRDLLVGETETYFDGPVPANVMIYPGDLVIGMDGDFNTVTWTGRPAALNQRLCVLRARPSMDQRFLSYLIPIPLRAINDVTYATTVKHLSSIDLLAERVVVPPLDAQIAIANYLDAEIGRIEALIAKKQRIVELIDERLRVVSTELLSSQPGWPLKRLLSAPMAYGVLVPRFVANGEGVPMLRINNLDLNGYIKMDEVTWIESDLSWQYRRTVIKPGDLVLSVVGSMGRSAVVPLGANGWNLNRPLARLQTGSEMLSRILWHWTRTTGFLMEATLAASSGAAQPTLNLGDLANFNVGLPTNRDMWPQLLESLERQWSRTDEIRHRLLKQCDALTERRQAVITAAVTGQSHTGGS